MKNGVESIKHRKTEGHDRLLLRSSDTTIAFLFNKRDVCYTTNLYFCASHEKTENKFIDINKITHMLAHK
jgi:hypothetical protein